MSQIGASHTWVATAALLLWPIVALALYRSLPCTQATLCTFLGGYLLLPVQASIKLAEGIPQLDKTSAPALGGLLGYLLLVRQRQHRPFRFGLPEFLGAIFIFSPFVTSLLNGDATASNGVVLPAAGAYDGLSAIFSQVMIFIPFMIGRRALNGASSTREILRFLTIAGLIYSLPMLFEIRMSPQLHYWLYGYYPFGFSTEMRYGGFKPVVFLENGLVTAFFIMTSCVAATSCWRTRSAILPYRLPNWGITSYLAFVLILCKSLGALLYGAALVPIVRICTARLQIKIAAVLALFAILYPVLRIASLVPTDSIIEISRSIDEERARSLEFRFENEDHLLARAFERPIFGWGRWGRSRIYNANGQDISVTDGRWEITLGQFGIVGFIAEFGLLAWPIFKSLTALRFMLSKDEALFLAAHSLIIGINLIDLLPNASLGPWTWLLAGALLGRTESAQKEARRKWQLEGMPTDLKTQGVNFGQRH